MAQGYFPGRYFATTYWPGRYWPDAQAPGLYAELAGAARGEVAGVLAYDLYHTLTGGLTTIASLNAWGAPELAQPHRALLAPVVGGESVRAAALAGVRAGAQGRRWVAGPTGGQSARALAPESAPGGGRAGPGAWVSAACGGKAGRGAPLAGPVGGTAAGASPLAGARTGAAGV